MWLVILGLLNGIVTGLVYSLEELWFGILFCLVPFAGIILTRTKISGFLIGYGMGYYMTGISFLYALADVVPLPVCTSYVLLTLAVLLISAYLTLLLWLAFYPVRYIKRGSRLAVFWIAGFYVLGEWLQEISPFVSFPWFRLAAAAVPYPLLIQGASLGGGLLVSFFLVLWNALLAKLLIKRRADLGMAAAVMLIASVLLYGEVRLYQEDVRGGSVLVVQGNHEGSEKWTLEQEDILADYERLIYEYAATAETGGKRAELIVLPETALPYAAAECRTTREALLSICRGLSAELLLGAIEQEKRGGQTISYNAVYHVTEQGFAEKTYRKRILVPFGEYLPFAKLMDRFCPWLEDFMTGNYFGAGSEQNSFETSVGRMGVLICYESIFPAEARRAVSKGAELLTVVSNDSWFQGLPAMQEHYAHAVLRAVETDRYVIRAGNTGISGVIDNRGRTISGMPENMQGGFAAEASARRTRTLYSRMGDVFGGVWLAAWCLLVCKHICVLIFSVFSDIMYKIKPE